MLPVLPAGAALTRMVLGVPPLRRDSQPVAAPPATYFTDGSPGTCSSPPPTPQMCLLLPQGLLGPSEEFAPALYCSERQLGLAL